MRKMRLNLDKLVVEAFPTSDDDRAARGTVRGYSGLPGCPEGDDVGVLSYYDIHSNTGGFEHCICPREVASADGPC